MNFGQNLYQWFLSNAQSLVLMSIVVIGIYLLTVFENLEALYICRNVIIVYPDCKSMIDVARQKLMNDPMFKHLSEDCQEYYFDFEAYASHLQEHGKFLVTEHGIFELPE